MISRHEVDEQEEGALKMSIWNHQGTPDILNQFTSNTLVEHLDIQFLEVGDDYIKASMPVDRRTVQPAGFLHGGASVVLAETLGSVAAYLCIDASKKYVVGVEVNANHVRSVKDGQVIGTVKPIHIGNKTQVWQIRIVNDQEKLVCISRITLAVLDKR